MFRVASTYVTLRSYPPMAYVRKFPSLACQLLLYAMENSSTATTAMNSAISAWVFLRLVSGYTLSSFFGRDEAVFSPFLAWPRALYSHNALLTGSAQPENEGVPQSLPAPAPVAQYPHHSLV